MISAEQKIFFLKNQVVRLSGNPGDIVSVFGFDKATMSSEGLTYDVDKYSMGLAANDSSSNSLANHNGIINIIGSALLICDINIFLSTY